jgi:hypothetical protein
VVDIGGVVLALREASVALATAGLQVRGNATGVRLALPHIRSDRGE